MKTFLTADMHHAHDNMYKFTNSKGERVRPWAKDAEEGDAIIIEKWNSRVKDNDKVYVLGDVAIKRKGLQILEKLNGRKILIRGNHDIFKLKDYLPYFDDIRGSHKLDNFILSHYPIHPMSFPHWCKANIHGHTHDNKVWKRNFFFRKVIDKRYLCVSLEQVDGFLVDFEEIKSKYK